MKFSLNLIGIVVGIIVVILLIIQKKYVESFGWIVAVIWATSAYFWERLVDSQNLMLERVRKDLQQIISTT